MSKLSEEEKKNKNLRIFLTFVSEGEGTTYLPLGEDIDDLKFEVPEAAEPNSEDEEHKLDLRALQTAGEDIREDDQEEGRSETTINPSVLRLDLSVMRLAAKSDIKENILEDLGGFG